ncbi:hypothetical protein D9M73_207010 [compost metagenome]
MLDVRQLAVQPANTGGRIQAAYADSVLEWCCGQQLDTDMVSDHVGEGQAQLGVAVERGLGAGNLRAVKFQFATVFVRSCRCSAGTDDEIAGLVGLG